MNTRVILIMVPAICSMTFTSLADIKTFSEMIESDWLLQEELRTRAQVQRVPSEVV
jgi:hypothetical protein